MPGTSDATHKRGKSAADSSSNWTRRQLLAKIGKLTAGTLVSTTVFGAQERAAARQPSTASPSAPSKASPTVPSTASPHSLQSAPSTASPSAPSKAAPAAPRAPATDGAKGNGTKKSEGGANENAAPAKGNGAKKSEGGANENAAPTKGNGAKKPGAGANGGSGCMIVSATVVVCGSATVFWLAL
jgi:hypothetical protein